MDKQHKLRKYRQKDYSQLIEFPVEIVGRNGEIRTYSFEESVRLYQRRIASAPTRYSDREVVSAEISHCRSRVQQLRRSYFERFAPDPVRALRPVLPGDAELAAEVAAFLDRQVEARTYRLAPLGDAGHATAIFVEQVGAPSLLLYLYKFEPDPEGPARVACDAFLGSLAGRDPGGELEHLHAAHLTADFGLVLTGKEPRPERDPEVVEAAELFAELEPRMGLLQHSLALLRAGAHGEALRALDALLAQDPDDRNAALTASLAALQAGQLDEAEMYVRLALSYRSDDAVLHYQAGVVRLLQARLPEASASFEAALGLRPEFFQARVLAALLDLHAGRMRAATALMAGVEGRVAETHRSVHRMVQALLKRARWRRACALFAGISLASSAWWVLRGYPYALPCFAGVAGCAAVVALLVRQPAPLALAIDVARHLPVPRELLPPRGR